jgi:hypothetical protein
MLILLYGVCCCILYTEMPIIFNESNILKEYELMAVEKVLFITAAGRFLCCYP